MKKIDMEGAILVNGDPDDGPSQYEKLNELYDECLKYLQDIVGPNKNSKDYQMIDRKFSDNNYKEFEETSFNVIDDANISPNETQTLNENIVDSNNFDESAEDADEFGEVTSNRSLDCTDNPINSIDQVDETTIDVNKNTEFVYETPESLFKIENELDIPGSSGIKETNRLRRFSEQLPKIIITESNTSLNKQNKFKGDKYLPIYDVNKRNNVAFAKDVKDRRRSSCRHHFPYVDYPRRLVSKGGTENIALISHVPFEKLRLLNDAFHTLIHLRWRWIVSGTVALHFALWLVFALFWYVASLAHYDFEPDPPQRACITGGKDFVTIFLASVEAQTTIGFGDRTIDEECPESIFLFVMQLILGTGLSGVLTCVVYAKLTRPEKLSKDGVGFSKKAVVSQRDGKLCLMFRSWDLNHDHIISSDFTAHFVKTRRTKEGEVIRYYAHSLCLQQQKFLLWPVTVVHVIDENSPLYNMTPEEFLTSNYEITVSLKGASASMGTFTQSQTSYLPTEVMWGYRLPNVVRYDRRKQKYVIDDKKLNQVEQIETPHLSAAQLHTSTEGSQDSSSCEPGTPSSFSDQISSFQIERASSFRRKHKKL